MNKSAIVLAEYDSHWASLFSAESERVRPAFGAMLLELHHIGSTSIAGLCAKPIIDMLAIVSNVQTLDTCSEQFETLGYEVKGEFGLPGRRYFRKDDSLGRRTHHLHAYAPESAGEIARHLNFRDYLRAHPDTAAQYGVLKQQLVERCQGDMHCYSNGKSYFIHDVEQRAADWKALPLR